MAKGRKTGGRDFPPGVSGNPKGGPGLPQDLKNARKLNQVEIERICNRYLYANSEELMLAFADPQLPAIEKIVISILLTALDEADQARIEWVFQRVLGKVKDQLEVTTPQPFVIHRRSGDQVLVGAEVKKEEGG